MSMEESYVQSKIDADSVQENLGGHDHGIKLNL